MAVAIWVLPDQEGCLMVSFGDRLAKLERRRPSAPAQMMTKEQRDKLVSDALANGSAAALLTEDLSAQQRAVVEAALRADR